jgi:hypothetical protein
MGQEKQDCHDRTGARTELSGQGCEHRTARMRQIRAKQRRQPEKDSHSRQLQKDRQNKIARTELSE